MTGRCCWATRAASCSPCSTNAGPIYESVAKATVVTDGRTADEVVADVLAALR